MKLHTSRDWIRLWLTWVLASTSGILLGFALSYLIVRIAKLLFGGANEDLLFSGTVWLVLVLTHTFTQWLVLRGRFANSGWWFVATIAGWVVAIATVVAIAWLLTYRLGITILGITIQMTFAERTILVTYLGSIVGAAQWTYFRRQLDSAWFWILGSGFGWALLSIAIGQSITNVAEMMMLGAIPGAITGIVLILFNQREGLGTSVGSELAA